MNRPTLETDALKAKWSGDPTATGYIEELEEKCSNFEFQCIDAREFLRQTQELCHEYLNAKIKAERERDEVLIELEEYRSIAENTGAKKAVSEKEKAISERDAAIDALMKIYYKETWGFWIFKRYSFYVRDEQEGLTEILVDKNTWQSYDIGDTYEIS